jgi:alpha-L-fucosidase 2
MSGEEMLSDQRTRPGVIALLPAIPDTLTEGEAKGIVCRTQAKIDDLAWNLKTRKLSVTISSLTDQTIKLSVGGGIESIDAPDGVLPHKAASGAGEVEVKLSQAHPVTLHLTLGTKEPSSWIQETAH